MTIATVTAICLVRAFCGLLSVFFTVCDDGKSLKSCDDIVTYYMAGENLKRSILLMRKTLPPTIIVFVLSIIIASAGTASPVPAITQTSSMTTVYLDPPTINGTVDEEFNVSIMIRNAPDIMAWQAGMIFDPDILNCTDFREGEFLKGVGETLPIPGTINNTAGVITPYGWSLLGEIYASGDGRLAYATFKVKAPGVSDLHLQDVKVSSWKYVDTTVEKIEIPTNIIDVYTVVVGATSHTVVTVSNSTGTDRIEIGGKLVEIGSGFSDHFFNLARKEIGFNVIGPYPGFSNVTIPKALLSPEPPRVWAVIINGTARIIEVPTESETHTSLYFTYPKVLNNIKITTRFMSSIISITLSEDSIPVRSSVTISGTITAADESVRPNVPVTIYNRTRGDVEWTTLATVTTDQNGVYSYPWTPETTGTYEVKASWPGDEETIGDETSVQTLNVKGAAGIPLEIVAAAVAAIIIIAAIVVYFVKFRKP